MDMDELRDLFIFETKPEPCKHEAPPPIEVKEIDKDLTAAKVHTARAEYWLEQWQRSHTGCSQVFLEGHIRDAQSLLAKIRRSHAQS